MKIALSEQLQTSPIADSYLAYEFGFRIYKIMNIKINSKISHGTTLGEDGSVLYALTLLRQALF